MTEICYFEVTIICQNLYDILNIPGYCIYKLLNVHVDCVCRLICWQRTKIMWCKVNDFSYCCFYACNNVKDITQRNQLHTVSIFKESKLLTKLPLV